jgi:hypothetical protein
VSHFVLYFSNTQLRNSIYDLEFSTLEELRRQLNKLKSCAGAKECTIRYKMPNNNIDGMLQSIPFIVNGSVQQKVFTKTVYNKQEKVVQKKVFTKPGFSL